MGPTIILDKSALQGLSRAALRELTRYFFVHVPQVLLMEILVDLVKPGARQSVDVRRVEVARLAAKVPIIDSVFSVDYKWLCVAELLGRDVPLDRCPKRAGGRESHIPGMGYGVVFGVSPQNEAILRWRRDQFSQEDFELAAKWRRHLSKFDFESWRRASDNVTPRPRTMADVLPIVELMLSDEKTLTELVRAQIRQLSLDHVEDWVWQVWRSKGSLRLRDHLPFTVFLVKLSALFHVGIGQGVLSMACTPKVDPV